MKKIAKFLMVVCAATLCCGIASACDDSNSVIFQASDGYIQWKYVDEIDWNNLIAIEDLRGEQGENGLSGATGKSAYELAVENGYKGTQAQWLDSLVGKDGKSAYEIAVENGFKGSEQEWFDSLKGNDGKSAYEMAVENGFKGTKEDWIESLSGKDGETGKSVFDIAKELGFTGTEEEWLETLKGEKGDNGFTPKIGDNGNWWIGETDTQISVTVKSMDRVGTDGLYFSMTIKNGKAGYEISKYTGTATDIVIPNVVFGSPVISIASGVLPTSMTSLSISSNMVSIPTFQNYNALKEVDFNNAELDAIPNDAFKNSEQLESIKNYENIKHIGDYAFYETRIWDIDYSHITSIGSYAFYGCAENYLGYLENLTEKEVEQFLSTEHLFVYIPDNVEVIGKNAYEDDDLLHVYYQGSKTVEYTGSYFYDNVQHTEDGYYYRDFNSYASLLHYDGKETTLVVPSVLGDKPVTTVEKYAFILHGGVERIELPSTVTQIGTAAFSYGFNLKAVFIPDSVTACGSAIGLRLDDYISAERPTVFFETTNFNWDGGVDDVADLSIEKYMIGVKPADIVEDDYCLYYKKTLSVQVVTIKNIEGKVVIPSVYGVLPVTHINKYALMGRSLTTAIDIPKTVTNIASYAFYGSSSLRAVNIPDAENDVNKYGFYSLSNCTIYVEASTIPENWDSSWYNSIDEYVLNSQHFYSTDGQYLCEFVDGKVYLSKYLGVYNQEEGLVVPSKIDGKTVYGIRRSCFEVSGISTSSSRKFAIIIPEAIEIIEYYAFYFNNTYSYVAIYLPYESSSSKPSGWNSSYINSTYYTYKYYADQWELVDGKPTIIQS